MANIYIHHSVGRIRSVQGLTAEPGPVAGGFGYNLAPGMVGKDCNGRGHAQLPERGSKTQACVCRWNGDIHTFANSVIPLLR